MTEDSGSSERQIRLDALLQELIARIRNGEKINIEDFAAEHPEFRDDILEHAPQMLALDLFGEAANVTVYESGKLLNERFRVIRKLGQGAMGEVYCAKDLEVGEEVALKFLPQGLATSATARERFRAEVRLARRIAHPNVARVYEFLEIDGRPCLSMEFVNGFDLAQSLRQVGRYNREKASKIACEICLGLEAAHEYKVLHRDIKPANILIDERGHVRITDFGLAALSGSSDGKSPAGTPRYLAPEVIEGRPASIRSEIYALGLVLYEVFTNRRPVEGSTPGELFEAHLTQTPTPPSELVAGLDPSVDRVILQCLEKNPENRPPDVASVRCRLPGGDPIEVALKARETPHAELVARSRPATTLTRRTALVILLLVAAGLCTCAWFGRFVQPTGLVDTPMAPEVLRQKADDALALIGYGEPRRDSSQAFRIDPSQCKSIYGRVGQGIWKGFAREKPTPLLFDYARSPHPLSLPENPALNRYTDFAPHAALPNEARVVLDSDGTLRSVTVAPSGDSAGADAKEPCWTALFDLADLDFGKFEPTVQSDTVMVWEREGVRVETARRHGRTLRFAVLYAWDQAPRNVPNVERDTSLNWFLFAMIALSAYIARRNILLGHADRRGALVVGSLVVLVTLLRWLLMGHKSPLGLATYFGFIQGAGLALIWGLTCAVYYLATEPLFRRFWPRALVTWVRALRGRLRDPAVGRDLVLGVLVGLCVTLVAMCCYRWGIIAGRPDEWSAMWIGRPFSPEVSSLNGTRGLLSSPVLAADFALWGGLLTIAFLAFLHVILARIWKRSILAVVLYAATIAPLIGPDDRSWGGWVALFVLLVGLAWVITRLGVLVHLVGLVTYAMLRFLPLTIDVFERRFHGTALALIVLMGLTLYGMWRAFAPAIRAR